MAPSVLLNAVVIEIASAFHLMPGLLDQSVVEDQRAAIPAADMLIKVDAVHRLGQIHDVLLALAVQLQLGQRILQVSELWSVEEYLLPPPTHASKGIQR